MKEIIIAVAVSLLSPTPKTEVIETEEAIVVVPTCAAGNIKIEIEDEEYKPWEGGKPWKFRKKKGKHIFEVTPDMLRGDIFIDVYTNATAPTINAVDREQKLQFMTSAWQLAQWYAMAKQAGFDIEKILPRTESIRDLASDFNLNIQQSDDQWEVKEEKMKLMQELQSMKQWMNPQPVQPPMWEPNPQWWLPPELWWEEQMTGQPNLSPNPMQWPL